VLARISDDAQLGRILGRTDHPSPSKLLLKRLPHEDINAGKACGNPRHASYDFVQYWESCVVWVGEGCRYQAVGRVNCAWRVEARPSPSPYVVRPLE
jgi:hypothetical protein